MAKAVRGKWRVIYVAYGKLRETGPMTRREAKQYYAMGRGNCECGHWDWILMVKVIAEYLEGKTEPVAGAR